MESQKTRVTWNLRYQRSRTANAKPAATSLKKPGVPPVSPLPRVFGFVITTALRGVPGVCDRARLPKALQNSATMMPLLPRTAARVDVGRAAPAGKMIVRVPSTSLPKVSLQPVLPGSLFGHEVPGVPPMQADRLGENGRLSAAHG